MNAALSDLPHVGDVRGDDMFCAVELVEDKNDRQFFDAAKKIGPTVIALSK